LASPWIAASLAASRDRDTALSERRTLERVNRARGSEAHAPSPLLTGARSSATTPSRSRQTEHRRERRPTHRELQHDADLHAVHHNALGPRRRSGVARTLPTTLAWHKPLRFGRPLRDASPRRVGRGWCAVRWRPSGAEHWSRGSRAERTPAPPRQAPEPRLEPRPVASSS